MTSRSHEPRTPWHRARCSRSATRRDVRAAGGADARAAAALRRSRASVRSCGRSSSTPPTRRACAAWPRCCGRSASGWPREAIDAIPQLLARPGAERRRDPAGADRSGLRRPPAPRRAPTRSSCPTRCSSPNTTPSRRPAPATARGSPRCSTASRSWRGSASGSTSRFARPVEALLEALLASYREWGGTASPPRIAIVDWREVPTWSEFEILRDAFIALGVPTVICDPRDLEFAAGSRFSAGTGRGLYANGEPIDLVYRRVLINDIVARRDRVPRAARRLPQPARSASPTRCAARSRTRRRSSRC